MALQEQAESIGSDEILHVESDEEGCAKVLIENWRKQYNTFRHTAH